MDKQKKAEIIVVLKALNEGWSLVDERDEDDFMVFVNESRDEKEDFYPKKELIEEMQRLGFIYPIESLKRTPGKRYIQDNAGGGFREIIALSPVVYFFTIAPNGDELLNSENEKT